MTRYAEEFRDAWRQREANRPPRGAVPLTDADERRFHLYLAKLYLDLGRPILADLHLGHVRVIDRDCRPGCRCAGCELTRVEVKEIRDARDLRARKAVARA